MAPHQQPGWTPRAEGLTWGGLGGAPLRNQVDRLRRTQAAQRQAQQGGRLIVAQAPMTGDGLLAATGYITEVGRWLVTAHATVRTLSTAAGRLEVVVGDIAHYPGDPAPSKLVTLGGDSPVSDDVNVSWIVLADGGTPGYVGGRYYPTSGDVDEAWLVWRAFRLA